MFGCNSQGPVDRSQDAVGAKVLFCRDTIVHKELLQHAFRLDHLGRLHVLFVTFALHWMLLILTLDDFFLSCNL
jgi:hypothetical protein